MTTRIMIVDDEPAIGRLLLYQLRGFGYEASYVQSGLLALQRFVLEKPDLVLLDVMMPHISGWEVCRQIRACSAVPVIMLTAKSADLDVVAGLDAGADDYITKPFTMAQLQARITAVLRRAEHARVDRAGPHPVPRPNPHLTTLTEVYRTRPPATRPTAAQSPVPGAAPAPPPRPPTTPPRRLGQQVREAREARGLSLHQIERTCKIRWEFLQAIEQENWSYVPHSQLRVALRTYTDYLGLDLRALLGRAAPAPARPDLQMHLAAVMAVVLVLLVVGFYLF